MDYRKYLKKLQMSKSRGICIGVGVAVGVALLAALVLCIFRHIQNGCGCCDYDFDDEDDFDDGENDSPGCSFANESDFVKD